jgi:alpha-glucosidase
MFLHGSHKLVAYGRFDRDNAIVVVLNNNYEEVEVRLSVDRIGIRNEHVMRQLMLTTEDSYILEPKTYKVENNQLFLTLPKISAVILKAE